MKLIYRYQNRKISNAKNIEITKHEINQLETKIESQFKILKDNFTEIEQVVNKQSFPWFFELSKLEKIWKDIKGNLDKNEYPNNPQDIYKEHQNLSPLNEEFNKTYEDICTELKNIEGEVKTI